MRARLVGAAFVGFVLGGFAGGAIGSHAQAIYGSLDNSVTQSDLNAAIVSATPPDCPAPASDALVATPGVQPKCMPRPDAQRATQVQSLMVVTAADGTFGGNWPVPFATTPTGRVADIEIAAGATAPYKCSFYANAVTATTFSGKCRQILATTLPTATTALLGLVVNPVQNAAAGLTVRVIGRQ